MKKLLITIILLTLPDVFAQEVLKLNLEKSLSIALENNHDLKIAAFEMQIADEQIREAFGSSVLPEISGNVNYQHAVKKGEIIIDVPGFFSGSFPQGTDHTMSLGITVDQPLFTGAVFFATRIANVYAEITQKTYYSTKAALIKDVKRSYYSFLLARQFLNLSNLTLKAAEDNLSDVSVMYDAGIVPEYDLIRARVQVQNLLPEVQKAENSITLAENGLRLVLGLKLDQEILVEDSLSYREIDVQDFGQLSSILEKKNFTLQQLKLQMELQDKAASFEFSKHFPELYLSGNWATIAQENDPRDFFNWRYKYQFYIGLNLKVPIFNGWQTTSRVEQAELDLQKIEEEFTKTDMLLKNQLEDLLLKINETEYQIDAYAGTIEQAQLGYDYALKRYASGIGTQLESIDSLVELTRARTNYLNAIFDYYVLHAQLEELLASEVQVEIDSD